MSNLPIFGAYAAAFEESLIDDDWSRLEQYFTPDASYAPGDGTQARGRDAVLLALKESVTALERKCDSREIVGTPDISEEGNTITLKFTIKYTREGLPDLLLPGYETALFTDGAIQEMEDIFEDSAAMAEWMAKL